MQTIAASIMCADQLKLEKELRDLEKANVELLHCDVMDGVFVNNLAMGPYVLEQIKESANIPLDIHLATENPSNYIDLFAPIHPKYISFHVEASNDVVRDINKIKEYGIEPVLALSPQSPIEMIKPYISMVPMILMMTVNPGFAGQKFNYKVLDKLDELNALMETMEHRPLIEVDGNINQHTIPLLLERGANVYVLGTSALFNKNEGTYTEKVQQLRELFKSEEFC
ncbi:ribulose-phosphate 3-epimerase [Neobacillus mesonae]|uniref:ribulose-phosphate 3-epimerase n=1 Tax=Neobacillus mesonae TaxID=1193713 RepID=UPI0020402938|nr:ribulose-phosphate 3-epimerase [Neobacillus mesonae]MCM3570406.1 ribulose-phosphate 3-epimerase [Neobacillus mesonae]